jgi:hypothetical protein
MMWQKSILSMIKTRSNKKIALAIDTSTVETRTILINNIVKLFGEVKPDTTLIQADFKIRSVTPILEPEIKWFKHGKASYTEVLEWGEKQKIDTLFYITDVTGYFYDDLKIDYEVIWLVPDDFLPRVPFGKAIKVA